MTGKILGFDATTNIGTVSGDDGKRYKFTKEDWKEKVPPQKDARVDFDMSEDGSATEIYQIVDKQMENNETLMGLLAVGITFFFGFFGTLISRLVLAKQPMGKTVMPTLIHFIITVLALVPIFGWIIYLIGTLYYMIKNYKLVVNDPYTLQNKYA